MVSQSESILENQLIAALETKGFKYEPTINNYEALLLNFRDKLNLHNKENLKENPLSDKEFNRVLAQIEDKSIIESAIILRDKFVIIRDDNTELYLELMNTKKWCKNNYQVINQMQMHGLKNQRYDVTLLVNGVPLVHIELKRRGRDCKAAFDQIENYKKQSMLKMFKYIQIFVCSNGEVTKYFSNNNELNYNFAFYWTDEHNKKISNIAQFAESFLEKCHISEMISRYMVIQKKQRNILVLRPYQVYAVKSIIERTKETNNNGFVWHTTGSGKTLTSFKVAQILRYDPEVKAAKIIFLVDRRDLDSQTSKEFKAFGGDDFLDTTNNTRALVKQLSSDLDSDKLIVTTIQKLARLIQNEKNDALAEQYNNKKVIFIIDECHRSQYGKMHADVRRVFQKSQFFGFTGTPLLIEEQTNGEKLTADNFEKCLHKYLVKDAIADKNVLGFNADYYSVNEVADHDAKLYDNPKRLRTIASCILEKHSNLTHGNEYCAVFAVSSIKVLIEYYKIFKELNSTSLDESNPNSNLNSNLNSKLKISAIFSINNASDQDGEKLKDSDAAMEMIIDDYNKMYNTEYTKDGYSLFFEGICNKIKSSDIDIVIVVDMLLTGFDAKPLNTLYIDKNLKYHNLLQAYSRTNRVYNDKKTHGNIVCFRDLKPATDEALKLFSDNEADSNVIIKDYQDQKSEINQFIDEVNTFGTIDEIMAIQSETKKLEFVSAMKKLIKKINTIETFTEFKISDLNIDIATVYDDVEFDQLYGDKPEPQKTEKAIEYKINQLKSIYTDIASSVKNDEITHPDDDTPLREFEFELAFLQSDKINVDYILNLLDQALNSDDMKANPIKQSINLREIKAKINKSDIGKKELLNEFIDTDLANLVNAAEDVNIEREFNIFLDNKLNKEISDFCKEVDFSVSILEDVVKEFKFSGYYDDSLFEDGVRAKNFKFHERIEYKNKIKTFILGVINKYLKD